ncbi:PKD domain-containing protein [Aridibaculum aurantiacum]|uniref:PKD domain-containing protein n=1 Tax=Aridibaculum aurantiacum TaxID=2810307 RepID=UPI001A97090D|nr:PKD domain-containing protein [Aridibaculum aurantiacum]
MILLVAGSLGLQAQNLSNRGREFWLAYGHNNLFHHGNGQQLVLYLSTEQAATVTVSVNGTGFSQTYNIPANTVRQSIEIPKNGPNDARIQTEGESNRGIHISSNVPIVAYAHQYGANSSGATMLMPVETFGYTYYSLNYHQESNSNPSYSWFFVVASENNTRVEITPSVVTQGGRAANVPFVVNLQRGQVYNVFGQSNSLVGQDLTGSKIRSIAGSDGKCHPIGVFSGASRMIICGSSGEFMQQQIFPASAWGTRYLTYNTISTANINSPNTNWYRVAVRDPNTVVYRNGTRLTNLQRNFYYEFSGTSGDYIEADRPVLVGQYVPSMQSCASYTGNGDPEMFFLSPLEQAINRARFYATSNQSITNVYVSVIIHQLGFNSLTVNGSNAFDVVKNHPQNPDYRVAIKLLPTNSPHTIQSDSAFTAITYGFGNVESYGYNAGTLVNNLDALPSVTNTLSTIGSSTSACTNTPFNFTIKLSYKPIQMVWRLSQVGAMQPNQDVTVNNPVPFDSSLVGSRKFYEYRLPGEYLINQTGTFNIPISITSPEVDNCDNTTEITYSLTVNPPPRADFTTSYTGCRLDSAYLSGSFIGTGFSVNRYRWTFPDGSVDSVKNVAFLFPNIGSSNVRLRVIADNGCIGDTIKAVVTSPPPTATFGFSPANACEGGTVNFTDTSSYSGNAIHSWYWDFGNGVQVNAPTNAPQSQQYNAPGTYIVKHAARAGSCTGDTTQKAVTIFAKPTPSFTVPTGCLPDSMAQFINTSTVPDGQALTYLWNFGDQNATPANPTTDTARNPLHKYTAYGTYNVSLTVTTANGCTNTLAMPFTTGGFSPAINYAIVNENALCVRNQVQLRNQMNVTADSIYRMDIYWDAVNQPAVFTQIDNPAANALYPHLYPSFTAPATVGVTIKVVVYSRGGCISEKAKDITLHAVPVVTPAPAQTVCFSEPAFTLQSSVSNVQGGGVYSGNGTTAAGVFTAAQAGVGQHEIKYVFTSVGGCKDSAITTITVLPQPVADFTFSSICVGDSTSFTDNSSIPTGSIASYAWTFGDGTTGTDRPPFRKLYDNYGNYNVQLVVTSDAGCSSAPATKVVRVHALPAVDFAMPQSVCLPGGSLQFNNLTTLPNGTLSELSFTWNYGDGNSATTFNGSHVYEDSASYNIMLIATSAAGCTNDTVKTFNSFYRRPVADFEVSTSSVCQGEATTFTDLSSAPNSTISSYVWRFGDGTMSTAANPEKAYALPGNYTVRLMVSTPEGCMADTTQAILVNVQPRVDAGVNVFIPQGSTYQLHPFVNDTSLSFRWTPATYLNNANVLRPVFTAVESQTYRLMATGAVNCTGEDTVRITVLKPLNVPNAFSPNGDGINDTWLIPNLADYPGSVLEVYDRYGRVVYRTIGYTSGWNGSFNGQPLAVGTYYYIIDLKQPGYQPITGSVTILR